MADKCITLLAWLNPIVLIFRSPIISPGILFCLAYNKLQNSYIFNKVCATGTRAIINNYFNSGDKVKKNVSIHYETPVTVTNSDLIPSYLET